MEFNGGHGPFDYLGGHAVLVQRATVDEVIARVLVVLEGLAEARIRLGVLRPPFE